MKRSLMEVLGRRWGEWVQVDGREEVESSRCGVGDLQL
jgi:hypothetical protein